MTTLNEPAIVARVAEYNRLVRAIDRAEHWLELCQEAEVDTSEALIILNRSQAKFDSYMNTCCHDAGY